MEPQEFLAAVLPEEGRGRYCVFELPSKRQTFVDTVDAVNNTAQLLSIGNSNAFFALGTFNDKNRLAANALAVRALWVDIDCGPGKAYATKRLAVEALASFLADTQLDTLGTPWLVDSGGGVHVYWPLDEDVCIEDWQPVAESFKRTAQRLGLKIDMTVTADAARVLRVPGTFNYKYTPPRPVNLKQLGDIFTLQHIADKLDKTTRVVPGAPTGISLPSMRPAGLPPMSSTMKALTQNRVTYFKNIVVKTQAGSGCGQIQHYFDNAQDDGMEPLYRGLLSIAKVCEDGPKASVMLTRAHPYTEERMLTKLAEIKGPYPCTKLDSENPGVCGSCPHWGKITNPLALGWENALVTTEKEFTVEPEADTQRPGLHLTRPVPPRGFSYGSHGGVYRTVSEQDNKGNVITSEIMIMPYEFFMVDLLQDGDSYKSRFAAIRAKSVTYVVLPSAALASKDSTIKELSRQNIMASFGAGNDAHLYAYVRACVNEASAADSALRVPPRYGWQPDHSFALCDRVIQRDQQGYQFPSDNLRNLIQITQTRGALGEWQRYVQLIQDKGLWDVLGFMGLGFGSPLMEFAGAGTAGMTIHACSDKSGRGKTLGLQLAASIWGHPVNYPITPKTSVTTMLQRAGFLGNIPLLVDEVTAAQRASKGEFIPALVFDYSQGAHKVKGSGSANAELINDLFWRSLCGITSNEPAMEKMLTSRDTSSHGELYRMLEWHAKDAIVWSDAERGLKDILEHNHGHAGRNYAEWLVNNRDTAATITAACIAKVRKKLGATDEERYWVNGLGCMIAGLTLAGPKYANLFAFDTAEIFKAMAQWVFDARTLMASNAITAEDILNAYTREFHGNFVRIDPRKGPTAIFSDGRNLSPSSTRGRVAGRIEYDVRAGWVDYYIETATFKRYCAERNRSYAAVVEELQKTVIAVPGVRRDLLAKTGGPEMRVLCLQVSTQIEV